MRGLHEESFTLLQHSVDLEKVFISLGRVEGGTRPEHRVEVGRIIDRAAHGKDHRVHESQWRDNAKPITPPRLRELESIGFSSYITRGYCG